MQNKTVGSVSYTIPSELFIMFKGLGLVQCPTPFCLNYSLCIRG